MVPPPSPRPWAPAAIGGATRADHMLARRGGGGVYEQPLASKPVSVLLAIVGCCVLSCCLNFDDNELDEIAVHTME
ncbi:hypothetical protein MGG_17363 [Pyricularia oryzae 70-15]|uniref:Uncharacterized protein n=1 Tax=Pyricularia oryzae (strain 70-15 / ATCC MYA-4617 / FGSC 8958) TaxID=242507 RepID=G4NE35_PYRO7|nr:uncharacterized protein MGG_17363 [Pyricularia oryzae 70-15]EHA48570.1 hypothetical protein MGG_17363 [Pyricularia oryzae 70-15]